MTFLHIQNYYNPLTLVKSLETFLQIHSNLRISVPEPQLVPERRLPALLAEPVILVLNVEARSAIAAHRRINGFALLGLLVYDLLHERLVGVIRRLKRITSNSFNVSISKAAPSLSGRFMRRTYG